MKTKGVFPVGLAIMALAALGTRCQNTSAPPDTIFDSDGETARDSDEDSNSSPGTGDDWASCDLTSECVLAANSCCGVCGPPTIGDVDGVNEEKLDEHFAVVCKDPSPLCPGCPSAPNPELVATCGEGECAAVDLGDEALTACDLSTDCVIRTPQCCECGADTSAYALIALRADQVDSLRQLVCDPDAICATCAPIYPENAQAICDDDGHCAVVVE